MSQPVYEMMVKMKWGDWHIRLWVHLASPEDCTQANRKETKRLVKSILEDLDEEVNAIEAPPATMNGCQLATHVGEALLKSEPVKFPLNAIEVLNKKGNGGLYYPDWP